MNKKVISSKIDWGFFRVLIDFIFVLFILISIQTIEDLLHRKTHSTQLLLHCCFLMTEHKINNTIIKTLKSNRIFIARLRH